MKIFYSSSSPYVRKCMVVAWELGLAEQIQKLPSAANPVNRDKSIVAVNPLGKVPTFVTDSGQAIYDSRVICEYLNDYGQGAIFSKNPTSKWLSLTEQALADGILDAALLARYETTMRPAEFQYAPWKQGQLEKINSGLAYFEGVVADRAGTVDIGTIALGCALGYLDFRFSDLDWRSTNPSLAKWFTDFSKRESMKQTLPK